MQVENAVISLQSEFRNIDNLVAHNTSRVLKAYQNARVGSHVSGTGNPILFYTSIVIGIKDTFCYI